MPDRDLWDAAAEAEAEHLRDAGIANALKGLSQATRAAIHATFETVSTRRTTSPHSTGEYVPFTSEDVVDRLPHDIQAELDAHPNAIGGFMQRRYKLGVIQTTGRMIPAKDPKARRRRIMEWIRTPSDAHALGGSA